MNYDSDDALDAALFALPLEEPPADLRASILAATVYRPAPAFSPTEIIGVGVVLALATWLTVLVLSNGAQFTMALEFAGGGLLRSFSNASVLAWVAVGGATAIWMQFFTGTSSFAPIAQRVGGRPGR